ncbi:aldehyde ferredoxin oxidoreductase family protein [bacterium]|nr:aldehyde ferredoxin oxidoreductase family protein [bacterium]
MPEKKPSIKPFGYNGKILHVDLSNKTWHVEEPSEKWYRTYVGGSSMASYYLLKELKPGVDPLSAENVLVFACSVLTGAPLSGFNRFTVAAKSPLSHGFGETEAGGFWGPELKFSGFDGIVIKGRADKPVYLWINQGKVEIRDAAHLWGKDNWQTKEIIREEHGDKRIRMVSIGQAGENLVRFANVQHEMAHFNGRTGMGAVMGAKNLKAIAVRGKGKMILADAEKVREIGRWHNERIKSHPSNINLTKFGTTFQVSVLNHTGMLPTHNFRDGVFAGAHKINEVTYHDTIFHSRGTCYACSVKCKREVSKDDGKYLLDLRHGGPEYETLGTLGSMCEIDDLAAIAKGNQICGLTGMDTVAAGCVVAFAMECYEKGILTKEDTGGKAIRFGNADAMIWLLEQMAIRKGIGKTLSEGVKRAAEIIGNGADRYAFHIKGSELPAHDGRGKTAMAMGYALSATGADHVECPHDTAFAANISPLNPVGLLDTVEPLINDYNKVRYFSIGQRVWGINNCYGICNFCSVPIHAMDFDHLVKTVNAVTGWQTSLFEIMKVSERSITMSRVFNNREGFGPEDDRVIRRWHEGFKEGALKDKPIDRDSFRKVIDLYYEVSGWNAEGSPTTGKLIDLNLDWLIEEAV